MRINSIAELQFRMVIQSGIGVPRYYLKTELEFRATITL